MNVNCDVCGREVLGCTFVNGMKFCAKCYQETFVASKDWQLLDKDKKITDLEAKLAQHEKHNAWVKEFLEKYQIDTELTPEYSENPIIEYCEQVNDFRAVDNKIIEDLQNELAESEKQIKHLRDWLDDEILTSVDHESYYDTINEYEEELKQLKQQLAEKDKEIEKLKTTNDRLYKKNKKLENQIVESNIRFYKKGSIEQLEKVKEFVARQLFITTKDCSDLDEAEAKGCNELKEETIKEIDNQIKQLKGEE